MFLNPIKKIFFAAVIVLPLLFSCKKDKGLVFKPAPESITIGGSDGIVLSQINQSTGGNALQTYSINLDLDNDSKHDVMLTHYYYSQQGGSYVNYFVRVKPLNTDVLIAAYNAKDSVFYNTTVTYNSINPGGTIKEVIHNYQCSKTTPTATLYSVKDTTRALGLRQNEVLSNSGLFLNSEFELRPSHAERHLDQSYSNANQDTTFRIASNHITCSPYPENTPYYIAVKLNNNHHPRIGWIKLSMSMYKLTVVESALSK